MAIWQHEVTTFLLDKLCQGSMVEYLNIRFTEVGPDYICAAMPVDWRTHQPQGILHGGASVALAETIGSVAANLVVDNKKKFCVGMEINANHVRSVNSGNVTGKATPIHLGKTTHIWQIEIKNEEDKLVCISRLTMAVMDK